MLRLLAALLLVSVVASAAPVPKPDPKKMWAGQMVVLKEADTLMKVKAGDEFEMVPVRVINPVVLAETETTIEIEYAGKSGTLNKEDVVRADADGEAYFDKRIGEKPSVDLYLRRASLSKLRGNLDAALADHDKAIELSPSGAAYSNRGQLQAARKDYPAALADFNKALEFNPDDPFAFRGRGHTYEMLKKPDEALADYAKANELVPDAWAHTSAGRVLATKKEWAKATEQYDAAVKLNPKHAPAYIMRATARFETKDDKAGMADLDEAVKLLPNDPQVYLSRASAAGRRGLYADADKDLKEALRLNPKNAGALNLKAWHAATSPEAEHRDGEKAIDAAMKACEITKWKSAGYLDTLAAAYAEAGKWDDAVKWQKKALEDVELLENDGAEAKARLKLYEEKKPFRDTAKWKR